MKTTIIALACAAALVGCRKETPKPAPKSGEPVTMTATPSANLATQNVDVKIPLTVNTARCTPSDKTTFAANEPISLTLELLEAPSELQVSARVLDAKGETVAEALAPGEGKKSVTLTIKEKVKPGRYRLAGYWGGNVVCEKPIEVR